MQRRKRLKESLAKAKRAADATTNASTSSAKRNPVGPQALSPEMDQRGSRPSEQHSSDGSLEGETLNGVTHPEYYTDAIPDVNTDKPESVKLSDTIVENVIGHADPLLVFPRWGKGDTPRDTSSEEVQFRCPLPDHADHNPSASLNKYTGLWTCFSCEAGGDIYTLGGIKFGIDPKSNQLPELKRLMAEDLTGKPFISHGPYSVMDVPAVAELVDSENKERERRETQDNKLLQKKLQEEQSVKDQHSSYLDEYIRELNESLYGELVPEPDPLPQPRSGESLADPATPTPPTVGAPSAPMPEPADTTRPEPASPPPSPPNTLLAPPPAFTGYDELLKPGTFLSEFYLSCKKDRNPNDFHFFNGLIGLGFASGDNVTLADEKPVMGNLFLCFVAGTGTGKSQSGHYLEKVLEAAMPVDPTHRDGVKVISQPASGEILIDSMAAGTVVDPDNGRVLQGNVKGYLKYDELPTLVKQISRQGSTIDTFLTSMYDGSTVSTNSRTHKESIAYDPYLTMTSNIPPHTMREIFTQGSAASGFLNRFTFVTAKDYKPQIGLGAPVKPDYDYLGSKLHEINRWSKSACAVRPDAGGAELFEEFFNTELVRYAPRTGVEVEPMMVRLELMFKKFCLLFAVNEMSPTLTRDHVEKAIKLYWIVKPGFQTASDNIGQSSTSVLEDEITKKVTEYFIKHREPLTAGQIWADKLQIRRVAKRLGLEKRDFEFALKSLVGVGDLDEVKPPKGDSRAKPKYRPGS